MRSRSALVLFLLALHAGPRSASAQCQCTTLKCAAAETGRLVGTAVEPALLVGDANYATTVAREYNYVTAENVMKWANIEPAWGVWNWGWADVLVDWAQARGIRVKGHTLVWHNARPDYVNSNMTAAELDAAMYEHITTEV